MKEIPLTLGFTATVDDHDYEHLKNRRWCVVKAKRTQKSGMVQIKKR
jgi:hypothetical protein